MVIESSDVAIRSGRAYRQQTRDRSSVQSWGEVLSATTSPTATDSRTITQREQKLEVVELYQNYSAGGRLVMSEQQVNISQESASRYRTEVTQITTVTGEEAFQLATKDAVTDQVFIRIFSADEAVGESVEGHPLTLRELFSLLIRQRKEAFDEFMEHFRIGMSGGGTVRSQIVNVSFSDGTTSTFPLDGHRLRVSVRREEVSADKSEEELTQVQMAGQVKTSDGRTIDLGVDLSMGRSYSESQVGVREKVSAKLHDPLVINFDTGAAELKNESFRFDIDADGELDNIALLGQASGYLALDLNGDGIVNDGSELFGTKSGDGFADLRVYDVDGNGWIDENDPAFDRLKIWSKDADGNDQLVGLGIRGIGAIFLGSTPSEFSLKNDANETLGVIRSTGLFLREDGTAGTVQQLDLAARESA